MKMHQFEPESAERLGEHDASRRLIWQEVKLTVLAYESVHSVLCLC